LIFVVALIMLFILHRVISRIWKQSSETKSSEQMPASATSTSVGIKDWWFRFGTAAVLMLASALVLQIRSRTELLPPREPLSSLPLQIDGWTGQEIATAFFCTSQESSDSRELGTTSRMRWKKRWIN
jgi:hypothetical protein